MLHSQCTKLTRPFVFIVVTKKTITYIFQYTFMLKNIPPLLWVRIQCNDKWRASPLSLPSPNTPTLVFLQICITVQPCINRKAFGVLQITPTPTPRSFDASPTLANTVNYTLFLYRKRVTNTLKYDLFVIFDFCCNYTKNCKSYFLWSLYHFPKFGLVYTHIIAFTLVYIGHPDCVPCVILWVFTCILINYKVD